MSDKLQEYWLSWSVNSGGHIPLTAFYGPQVMRGTPPTGMPICLGYLRTRKSKQLRSYPFDVEHNSHSIVKDVETCDSLLEIFRKRENETRNGLRDWIEHGRGLQRMIVEVNNIPNLEETNTLTWTRYKRLKAKQVKADGIFYGILHRLDGGGRSYRTDGERMHKASADMKKYKKLAEEVLRPGRDEYYFEWSDMYNNGCGVCHYVFTPPPPSNLYGTAKTIQLGTGNEVGRNCAYTPMLDYKKEENNEEQSYCFIRTKGDLAYVKKNFLAWINQDLKWRRKDLKMSRECLLRTKCSIFEIESEREYLSSPGLQEKERIAIEEAVKVREEKEAREYAARPRYDVLNVVKLWDGEIYWQCSKCLEKNTSHEDADTFEKECHHCWEINRIDLTKELETT